MSRHEPRASHSTAFASEPATVSRSSEAARPALLDLHIEELIVDDLRATDRHSLAAEIEQELTRMGGWQEAPAAFGRSLQDSPGTAAETFRSSENETSVGRQIAQAIHQRLKS